MAVRRDSAGNGGRRLTVREAQVHTMQAQLRTITINDKQFTLAVFRQLRREDLIDMDTLMLRGLAWGFVNYHSDRKACDNLGQHRHVVWQLGDELRRDTLTPHDLGRYCEPYKKLREQAGKVQNLLRGFALLRGEDRSDDPVPWDEIYKLDDGHYHVRKSRFQNYDNVLNELARWPATYQPFRPLNCFYGQDYIAQQDEKHRAAYETAVSQVQRYIGDWTEEKATQTNEYLQSQVAQLEQTWAQRWAEIEALEQLFIAV